MGGDAVFGDAVHFSADLDFYRLPLVPMTVVCRDW